MRNRQGSKIVDFTTYFIATLNVGIRHLNNEFFSIVKLGFIVTKTIWIYVGR